MSEGSTALSLPDLMRRMSDQLDVLASDVHAIEHVIGEELGAGLTKPSAGITRLQRLDFIRQSLEDLALLSHLLSQDCTGAVSLDIASRLRLDATKHLLNASAQQHVRPLNRAAIGDVDLF